MGIADEIESYLKSQVDFINQDHSPEVITERPKARYNGLGWYRKCHRCDYQQSADLDIVSVAWFCATSHVCMRDSTLKYVKWDRWAK